ncbi:hypothetical protein [Methylomicrobium lacus]|uniref:hypothetical protein n=1 Tax=Methylomicrobium lacus TaxID=136992 RepID=UPI0035A94EC4
MQSPEYSSDSQNLAINGNLEYVYRFPGVSCNACNATYGGSRILALEAPPQIQNDPRFRSRWPISEQEHAAMQQEVAGYLDADCAAFQTFKPGDNFQPAYYDNQTVPDADFLWPNIRSFVVSERMKRIVFDGLVGDVEIVPVKPRKIGKRNDSGLPSGLDSGHPETLIEPYYQILVRAESDYPKGGAPISICAVCKHEAFDDEKRELVMHEEMWRGQPIFLLRTTLYVIVTEALAEKIQKAGATNVAFVPV